MSKVYIEENTCQYHKTEKSHAPTFFMSCTNRVAAQFMFSIAVFKNHWSLECPRALHAVSVNTFCALTLIFSFKTHGRIATWRYLRIGRHFYLELGPSVLAMASDRDNGQDMKRMFRHTDNSKSCNHKIFTLCCAKRTNLSSNFRVLAVNVVLIFFLCRIDINTKTTIRNVLSINGPDNGRASIVLCNVFTPTRKTLNF